METGGGSRPTNPEIQETNSSSQLKYPLLPIYDERSFLEGLTELPSTGASFTGAVFNLSTSIVGAGIMALPATMKVLGFIPAIFMIVLFAILTEASLEILVRFTKASKMNTYGKVMRDSFGSGGRVFLQGSIVLNNTGTLVVYMIMIGDVLSGTSSSGVHHTGLLESWFGHNWWDSRILVLLITTIFILAPLTFLKRIDSLRHTSALSVALAIVFVVVTAGIAIYKIFTGSIQAPQYFPEITDLPSLFRLFTSVPVLTTAYICHFNLHSILNELQDSNKIQPIIRTSLTLCSTVYVTTSVFSYLLFGSSTQEDVLSNFSSDLGIPHSSFLCDLVRVSYALHIMLVFPIVFFAVRVNLDGLCFPSRRHGNLVEDNKRFYGFTVLLLTVIYVVAIFVPSIWDAFQVTGATSAVLIGFIFPALIAIKDRHGIAKQKDKIVAIFMIVLAVLSNAIALYSNFYSFIHKKKEV